jgi:hypothetical protein
VPHPERQLHARGARTSASRQWKKKEQATAAPAKKSLHAVRREETGPRGKKENFTK